MDWLYVALNLATYALAGCLLAAGLVPPALILAAFAIGMSVSPFLDPPKRRE